MKNFWFVVSCLLCLLPLTIHAQCTDYPWLGVWPDYKVPTIQPRQVLLLYTRGDSFQALPLDQIGRGLTVALCSRHDSVPLRVLDRQRNDSGQLQVLLQPSRPLQADSLYELKASRGSENVYYLFENQFTLQTKSQRTRYQWRVAAASDTEAPGWLATPQPLKHVFSSNSEGTVDYVSYSSPLCDDSACLIRTTVVHLATGRRTQAYLFPWRNELDVGYFTCGGPFLFGSEEDCTVQFEAIDANGNRAATSPLPLQAPAYKPGAGW